MPTLLEIFGTVVCIIFIYAFVLSIADGIWDRVENSIKNDIMKK